MRPKFGTSFPFKVHAYSWLGCWEAKMLKRKLSFRNYVAEEGFQQSPQLREHSLEKRCARERKTLEDNPLHLWSLRVHRPKCSHQPETENRSPNLRPSFKRTNSLIATGWTVHILSSLSEAKTIARWKKKSFRAPAYFNNISHRKSSTQQKIPLQTH